ncbi:MAG: hypothetical protein EZS28_024103 [Streblomastix strix]|uniref:HNH nuclease domain-containing protein n=1 Tax=Streblomastix strix TaxID=222440 RepID=A0A5J4VD12_9EUKA|nr:MAG: hypothetical protein EZS28_024103 [Streblomastix strix]
MTQTETETEFITLKADEKYEISTKEPWIIRRNEDGFIPKFSKTNSGYLHGRLGEQVHLLHRLVAEQFVKNDDPINKTQIDHKNGNKNDNSIENLRWVNNSDNQKNKTKHNDDIIYEYVDETPDDAIIISDYGLHQVLHINEAKRSGLLFVLAYDNEDNQVENQTYPNIRIKSRAESHFINQQLNVQKKTGAQIVYLTDSNDNRVVAIT